MNTPHLKFHPEKLIQNYNNFDKTCKKLFSSYKICFSTKTNTNPLTINTLKKINSGFEVASLREIELTPKNSFRVMNGPAKTNEELKHAIKQNILLQIDSFSEIEKISKLKTKPKEVIIRIGSTNSKFGFSKKQMNQAIKRLNELQISLAGFQLHQGTLNKFTEFQKNLKEQKKIIKPHIKEIKYLNFGGGFPDNFQLKNLQLKLDNYLEEIKETFNDFNETFIFEPGRNIASDSYRLITKVITIKEKDEKIYAILDAGINILSKITLAQFKFNKIENKGQLRTTDKRTFTLAGPLLFNNDILGKWHGKLIEGDIFEVENVGAYCENLSWNIIYDKPKVTQ